MFTGIVQQVGTVVDLHSREGCYALTILTAYDDLVLGESIAVNGICLTVTALESSHCTFNVSPETLSRSCIKNSQIRAQVHLERALVAGGAVGGHWVSGHVDGILTLVHAEPMDGCVLWRLGGVPDDAQSWLVSKGSITIDGVSLTINRVIGDAIEVTLVPETLKKTLLSSLSVNDSVNVEYDLMAKLVAKQVKLCLQQQEGVP